MGRETALRVPLADILQIIAALDDIELADVTPEIQHIKMIKSPAEIAKLRVCAIVSDVLQPDRGGPAAPAGIVSPVQNKGARSWRR